VFNLILFSRSPLGVLYSFSFQLPPFVVAGNRSYSDIRHAIGFLGLPFSFRRRAHRVLPSLPGVPPPSSFLSLKPLGAAKRREWRLWNYPGRSALTASPSGGPDPAGSVRTALSFPFICRHTPPISPFGTLTFALPPFPLQGGFVLVLPSI